MPLELGSHNEMIMDWHWSSICGQSSQPQPMPGGMWLLFFCMGCQQSDLHDSIYYIIFGACHSYPGLYPWWTNTRNILFASTLYVHPHQIITNQALVLSDYSIPRSLIQPPFSTYWGISHLILGARTTFILECSNWHNSISHILDYGIAQRNCWLPTSE